MAFPTHFSRHLKAIRQTIAELGPSAVEFEVQRVRASVQNLAALCLKTDELRSAVTAVDAALPNGRTQTWSDDDEMRLARAVDAFEGALEAAGPTQLAVSIGAWSSPSCRDGETGI